VRALVGGAFGEQVAANSFGLTINSPGTPSVTLPAGGGGPLTKSLFSVSVPFLLTASGLTVSTQGGGSGSGISVKSSADVASAIVAGGFVTATTVHSQCAATPTSTTGSTSVATLIVNGMLVQVSGSARINVAGAGTLLVNEQITSPSGVLTVNALHLVLTGGTFGTGDVIVAQSRCGIDP